MPTAGNPDVSYMRKAVALALKGRGRTSPNPMVGALVVKGGRIIGRGYHAAAGLAHAEVVALDNAVIAAKGFKARGPKGAVLYVTLEPCVSFGRTPPCVDAIIEAGIKRVFVGALDPNPEVRGRGVAGLRRAGIEVVTGVLKAECEAINLAYNKHVTSGLPYVTLKLATSLDGRIATVGGDSKWITSKESRRYVHELRDRVDCVMVGSATALIDNPRLTTRGVKHGRDPKRALVDTSLKLPLDARFFKSSAKTDVFVFAGKKAPAKKAAILNDAGVEVIRVRETKAGVSLPAVLKELGCLGVTSLMVEGGGTLAAGFLKAGLVDKVLWFTAPLLIGSDGAPSLSGLGVGDMSRALRLKQVKIRVFGSDLLVEGCL